jgi:PAS domain S-box-containing protein
MSQQATVFEWLEAVTSPVFVLVDRQIRWTNSAAAALTEASDLQGKDFTELLAHEWRNGFSAIPQGELEILTTRGETRRVNIALKTMRHEGETLTVATVTHSLPREPASSLSESEEEYRMIAENVTDMITRTSAAGVRTYVSSVCRSLLGYEPEELLGQRSEQLIHPEDFAGTARAWDAMAKSDKAVTFMCRMRHKSGEYIWFEVVGKAIFDAETGSIQEYVAVSRDISARKQMEAMVHEQERLRYELQKEQELNEVKSNLMRTISHEFRTPLALIVTSTDFLDAYLDRLSEERRKERLQAIRIQVKRLSDMLNDISFVVQGTLHHVTARKSMIELKEYCQSILEEIQTTIGKNHRFAFEADDALEQGIADKALVVRMLTNLLSNAVKYSADKSLITLRLKLEDGDAVLQVVDQGIGIAQDEQKYIFEPFYRSRSVIDQVGGTGLGLSIVKDCVDLHGGTISVDSTPGNGATFTIRLPQTPDGT